ncbi:MAG: hypothetical protein JWO89_977 [Verrucomicrobiaceae bacterium]|nr:hypothetical protein [Verrucomicrobiaceae bacterium]
METKTTLLVFAISLLFGSLGVMIGGLLEKAKLQPLVDEERRLKLQQELRRQRDEENAAASHAEAQTRLKEATARGNQLDQQLTAKQTELAQTKEQSDKLKDELESGKQAAREQDIQHRATQTRVSDLESSLSAERGRLGALQTALDAKQDLVRQLTNELASTNTTLEAERTAAQQREAGLREQLAGHERILSSGSNQTEAIRAELERAKAAHTTLIQDAETKAADWSRKLVTSENKIQLLQKEILSLVNTGGSHGDAADVLETAQNLARTQDRAKAAEARVLELEEQLAQGDPTTRKKLRETEYRVCELEFKLAEADEAKTAAIAQALFTSTPAETGEQPSPEYLAKLHEQLAATHDKCVQLTRERDEARAGTQGLALS